MGCGDIRDLFPPTLYPIFKIAILLLIFNSTDIISMSSKYLQQVGTKSPNVFASQIMYTFYKLHILQPNIIEYLSDLVKKKNVTCIIHLWNKTYSCELRMQSTKQEMMVWIYIQRSRKITNYLECTHFCKQFHEIAQKGGKHPQSHTIVIKTHRHKRPSRQFIYPNAGSHSRI